jgi:hypothetical protein
MNTVLFADDQAVDKSDDLQLVSQILKLVRRSILKFQLLKNNGISTKCGSQRTNTGLFINPSGNCDPCGAVAGIFTPKGSMSTEGERLQVSVLPYRCSICAPLVTRQMSIL